MLIYQRLQTKHVATLSALLLSLNQRKQEEKTMLLSVKAPAVSITPPKARKWCGLQGNDHSNITLSLAVVVILRSVGPPQGCLRPA